MTIEIEHIVSGANIGKVVCTGEGHRETSHHLAVTTSEKGIDAPLTENDFDYLLGLAQRHDRETKGTHDIRVLIFSAQ